VIAEETFNKFTGIMTGDILAKLEGSHDSLKRFEFPDKPSKLIVLGTLGDRTTDNSTDILDQERTLSSVKNNSLAIRFLTDPKSGKISVIPSFSLYYRVYPTFQEQKDFVEKNYEAMPEEVELAKIWKRKDIEVNELVFNITEKWKKEAITRLILRT